LISRECEAKREFGYALTPANAIASVIERFDFDP
jgi:hypothetical protein